MKITLFLFLCGASLIAARSIDDYYFGPRSIKVEIDYYTLTYYYKSYAEKSNVLRYKDVKAIASNAFINFAVEDLTLEFADQLKLESESFNNVKGLKKLSIKSAIVSPDKEKVFEPIKNLQSLEFRINAENETLVEIIPKVLANLTEFKIFNSSIKSIGGDNSSCESCSTMLTLSITESKISLLESKALFARFPSLKELYLSENSLRNLQPETFDGLDKLEYLDVHGNNLTTIAGNIFTKLKSLKVLNLMGNNLTTIEKGTFDGLHNLKFINLNSNRLVSIPVNIFTGLKSLKILSLAHNNLKIIPTGQFSGLTHLEFLSLTENNINKIEINAFSRSSIKYLCLGANNLTTLQPGIFYKMDKLESIKLFYNKIQEIPKNVFNKLKKLRKLEMGHNVIKTIKSDAFSGLNLQELSIESNNLTIIDDAAFRGLTVGELNLAYNNISAIKDGAFGKSTIQLLNLNNVRVNIDSSWKLPDSTMISTLERSHDFLDNLNDEYYFSKETLLREP